MRRRLSYLEENQMSLEPNREQIELFVDALFRHATKGFVAVRSFVEGDDKPFRLTSAALTGGLDYLVEVAEDDARRAAQFPKPVVFCPPLATFASKNRAREQDIVEGLALSVECDAHPQQARAILEQLLGPATVVVKSGGCWVNGGGEAEDKLHLHWRLNKPASDGDLAKLKQARDLAARLVGGDPSNKPVCHPIRWPGSWHCKAEPRLCEITALDANREVELAAVLAALQQATPQHARTTSGTTNGSDQDRDDWPELVGDIVSGRSLHTPLVAMAARLVGSGMHDGTTVTLLRALMTASAAPHYEMRWQARYTSIPRIVSSAREKFSTATTTTEPLGEWNAGDDIEPPPPRGWLLGNVFARTFLSSLFAEGGTGKTSLRYAQYLSLAVGRPLTGEHVFQRCRVLIVSLEDDANELRRRILAARLHYQIDRDEVAGWLFLAAPGRKGGKLMVVDANGHLQRGALADKLETVIAARKVDLVALDPFIKAHSVEENSNSAVDDVAQLLSDLAAEYDIAVDIPHHTRKGSGEPGDAARGRGASATKDAGRLIYTLTTMSSEEAKAFGIAEDGRRFYVRMDSAKVNITPVARAKWFRLIGIPLGNATKLYPSGDIVQTVEPWSPPELWADLNAQLLNLILTDIDAGLPDGNRFSDARSAKERAAWRLVVKHAPQKTEAQAREIIRTWVKNGVLESYFYENPVTRHQNTGLRVDDAKRPS
jgi:AAA domain